MKVSQATLIHPLFVPGVGDLTITVTSGPKAKFPGLLMELTDIGLKIRVMGKAIITPYANIKYVLVDEQQPPQKQDA